MPDGQRTETIRLGMKHKGSWSARLVHLLLQPQFKWTVRAFASSCDGELTEISADIEVRWVKLNTGRS